jgi:hypothetical protein
MALEGKIYNTTPFKLSPWWKSSTDARYSYGYFYPDISTPYLILLIQAPKPLSLQ